MIFFFLSYCCKLYLEWVWWPWKWIEFRGSDCPAELQGRGCGSWTMARSPRGGTAGAPLWWVEVGWVPHDELAAFLGVSVPSPGQECFTQSLGLCLALRNSFNVSHRFCKLVSKALSAQKLPQDQTGNLNPQATFIIKSPASWEENDPLCWTSAASHSFWPKYETLI